MKRLKGFTLAEVLITITMIGVIAAMTLPVLNNSTQRQQMGPALMKAINVVEATNKALMQERGVRHLGEITVNSFNYAGIIFEETLNASPIELGDYTGVVGPNRDLAILERGFNTADNITYFAPRVAAEVASNPGRSSFGSFFTLLVDVNGTDKGPNIVGRDLFVLNIDFSGQVFAKGSQAWSNYIGGDNPPATWVTTCTDLTNGVNQDASNCAGSIVDNAGRVTYRY